MTRSHSRRDALDLLLRVRRIERDRCALAHQQSEQQRLEAGAEASRASAQARVGSAQLQRAGEAGVIAALWRALVAGVDALHAGASAEGSKLAHAESCEAEARELRIAAEQNVSGLERLAERRDNAKRTRAVRADQRRIDDGAMRRRGSGLCFILVLAAGLAAAVLPSGAALAEAESRLGSASLERLLSDIRTRTKAIERREHELDERERGVQALEDAVTARISELDTVSKRIESRIAEWEESHGAKSVSKLAKIYGAMPAPLAAGLVEELDLELATAVLAKMKPKESAALLPLLSEPRALSISRFVGHPLGITPTPAAPEAQ